VQELVQGGQTMNPSTEDLLAAVSATNADEVVILPNNGNIVPVARQVEALADRPVHVVATGSVVEGFAALLEYDPEQSGTENAAAMTGAASAVVVGEVTRAVRSSSSPAGPIEEGDWLGLDAGGVRSIAASPAAAATRLLELLVTDDHELVTLILGEGATDASTRQIVAWLDEQRPGVEVERHHGGQPHYPYFIGVE
jgi:fatty acid kinase